MDKVPVIINRSGGTAAASGESLHASLELAFTNNGFDASIELVDGSELQQAFAQFADATMAEVLRPALLQHWRTHRQTWRFCPWGRSII
jgi:hypothetical protein